MHVAKENRSTREVDDEDIVEGENGREAEACATVNRGAELIGQATYLTREKQQ